VDVHLIATRCVKRIRGDRHDYGPGGQIGNRDTRGMHDQGTAFIKKCRDVTYALAVKNGIEMPTDDPRRRKAGKSIDVVARERNRCSGAWPNATLVKANVASMARPEPAE
jgi:hypothetical protein